MQRYANESSSELESQVNGPVCECLKMWDGGKERVSACASVWWHRLYICMHASLFTLCMCSCLCRCVLPYATEWHIYCVHSRLLVHHVDTCFFEDQCRYVCAKQKMFSALSLLAAVGRQSQGAESHYRTSQLPPTTSDAVHSLSHTHAHLCLRKRGKAIPCMCGPHALSRPMMIQILLTLSVMC